jgi:ribosome-associated protein
MLTAFFVEKCTCPDDACAGEVTMQITTPFIKLDSFLKAENAVSSGGEAKAMIADGYVSVNGEVELRRGRKLYPGDCVAFGKRKFMVETA